MAQLYGASVADELTFDRVMASLPDADREAVERVLSDGGFKNGLTEDDVENASKEGYSRGYRTAQREAKKPA